MNLFQGTSFRPLTVAIAATFSLVLVASTAHASGNVQWGVSVEVPVPATAVYPVYTPAPVAVQLPPPPPPPLPIAPKLPNIEHMQAKQQARIQWGAQVGLIEPHEYRRLQHTQQSIEQQRQWAYADGWLTYDEHLNLVNLLNGAVSGIERALAHGQKPMNSEHYAYATDSMPTVLTVWNMPPPAMVVYGGNREHKHHHGNGHGRGHHKDDRDEHRKQRLVAPPPPSPIAVQPVTSMPVIKPSTAVQLPPPVPAIFINGRGGQRFEPTK
jgi:hypothetical protein